MLDGNCYRLTLFKIQQHFNLGFFTSTLLVILFLKTVSSSSIEETEPAYNLSPRHFNPHPYRRANTNAIQEHENLQKQGPVVFPPNPEDEQIQNPGNVIVIEGKLENEGIDDRGQPVYNHPYAKLAKKQRYKVAGRFSSNGQDRETNTEVYQALANHASKVLTHSPENLKHVQYDEPKTKKNYEFSYKVLDRFSGDDFSHIQSTNARATNGEYRVKLPDGRMQVVSYVADGNGYKADVKYDPDNEIVHPRIIPSYYNTNGNNLDVQRIPVRELKTIHSHRGISDNNHHHGVYRNQGLADQNLVFLEKLGPTRIPVRYIDVGVTPTPPYLHGADAAGDAINQGLQRFTTTPVPITLPKVQIFTSNARDYISAGYIPSTTIPPYVLKNTEEHSSINPEVVNNGDHGLFNPTQRLESYVVSDQDQKNINEIEIIPTTATPFLVYRSGGRNAAQTATTTAAPYSLSSQSDHYENVYSDYQEGQGEYGIFYLNPSHNNRKQRGTRKRK